MTLRTQHDKPVYVRLRETIADAILAGKFSDGDPLPSVRALAAEEQANPLTVAKAYQGFQDEGLIVVKRGVGMFVAPGARARLSDGDSLASVRALAAEEQANPRTAAKAYQGFPDEGLIVVERGVGMFVGPGARARLSDSERSRFLKEEWPEIRARMKRLGIDAAE